VEAFFIVINLIAHEVGTTKAVGAFHKPSNPSILSRFESCRVHWSPVPRQLRGANPKDWNVG